MFHIEPSLWSGSVGGGAFVYAAACACACACVRAAIVVEAGGERASGAVSPRERT